jgi:transportin-3
VVVFTDLVSYHEGLPQALLSMVQPLKDGLLLSTLTSGNEKMISILAWLMLEIRQAVPSLIAKVDTNNFSAAEPDEIFDIPDGR